MCNIRFTRKTEQYTFFKSVIVFQIETSDVSPPCVPVIPKKFCVWAFKEKMYYIIFPSTEIALAIFYYSDIFEPFIACNNSMDNFILKALDFSFPSDFEGWLKNSGPNVGHVISKKGKCFTPFCHGSWVMFFCVNKMPVYLLASDFRDWFEMTMNF